MSATVQYPMEEDARVQPEGHPSAPLASVMDFVDSAIDRLYRGHETIYDLNNGQLEKAVGLRIHQLLAGSDNRTQLRPYGHADLKGNWGWQEIGKGIFATSPETIPQALGQFYVELVARSGMKADEFNAAMSTYYRLHENVEHDLMQHLGYERLPEDVHGQMEATLLERLNAYRLADSARAEKVYRAAVLAHSLRDPTKEAFSYYTLQNVSEAVGKNLYQAMKGLGRDVAYRVW